MFDKLCEALAEKLGIDKSKITMDSKIVEDLGADSLDVVGLLMDLEQEYNISFSEEEAGNVQTVGEFVTLLEQKLK